MPSFILRDIDPTLWRQVKTKAAAEGITVKELIFKLLTQWLAAMLVLSLGAGCAYHAPTEPTPVTVVPSSAPASIRLGVSSMTTSTYGVTATVLTRDGHFVPGVLITFAMDSGSVSPGEVMTNGNGVAQAVASPSTTAATLTVSGAALTSTTTIAGAPAAVTPPVSTPLPPIPLPPPFVQLQPITTTVGASTFFSVGGVMPGGSAIVAVSWAFGDGATAQTNSGTTSHTYATAGAFTASVTATDTLGRSASNSAPVTVNALPAPPPPPPPPGPATLDAALTCTVAAHVVSCNLAATYGGAAVPSTAITRVDWDLGNGVSQVTAGPTINYTYPVSGSYLIVASVDANVIIGGAFVPKTTATSKAVVIP